MIEFKVASSVEVVEFRLSDLRLSKFCRSYM